MPLHYNHVEMRYRDWHEASTLEVSLELKHPASGRETGASFDNLHTAVVFMAQNRLWPTGERLDERLEITLPHGEREIGQGIPELDGLTAQGVLDAWRARQGDHRLVIEIEVPDEAMLDEFDRIDWS